MFRTERELRAFWSDTQEVYSNRPIISIQVLQAEANAAINLLRANRHALDLRHFAKYHPFDFCHSPFHFWLSLLLFAVFPAAVRMAVISCASRNSGSTRSFGSSPESMISSNQ